MWGRWHWDEKNYFTFELTEFKSCSSVPHRKFPSIDAPLGGPLDFDECTKCGTVIC